MGIRNDYEYGAIGGDGASGFGGGFAWIILLVLIFLFLRGKDGLGHDGGCGCGCVSPCTIDKDIIKEADYTRMTETNQAEKTRALIETNYKEAQLEKMIKGVSETAELKAKIANLEQTIALDNKFAQVNFELSKVAKTQPQYAVCASPCMCGCAPRSCGESACGL